ncbi:hypothetical protein FB45DRAFT_1009626 [Roridomyces roridus]|uniref:BTB domain-containing protein n=1 Tax=Roridomyces roridus TaxID=1738132 RepID=A0AAD7B6X5_9AGAR|nr:hypothetical protein FB45DRAFT_1009626 [Roridomyces roridus]
MQVDDTPHRIPELWFEDGNIVIQAENSQFRVHRGILAACSAVFKDMLSFPQPADVELVEGCPVVHLTDAPTEVTVFLRAIFVPDYFMPFPAKTEYEIIRGCLRLSHKYGVEHLRLRALVHFSSRFRTTLSQYNDARYPYHDSGSIGRPQSDIISWLPGGVSSEMSCIQLAREVNAPWVLPLAFYTLSDSLGQRCTTVGEFIRGTTRNGLSVAISPEDQESFLSGHIRQTQFSTTRILAVFWSPIEMPECRSLIKCLKGPLSAVNTMQEAISECPSIPLEIWVESDFDMESWDHGICMSCREQLQRAHQAVREKF